MREELRIQSELELALGYFNDVCSDDYLRILNTKDLKSEDLGLLAESVHHLAIITSLLGRITEINPSPSIQFGYKKYGEMTVKGLRILDRSLDVSEFHGIRFFSKQDEFYLEPGLKVGIDCADSFSDKTLAISLFIKEYKDTSRCSVTISELVKGITFAEAYAMLQGVVGEKAQKCRDAFCEAALENTIFFQKNIPQGLGSSESNFVRGSTYEAFYTYLLSTLFAIDKAGLFPALVAAADGLWAPIPFDEKLVVRYRDASPANFILETGKSKISLDELVAITDVSRRTCNIDWGVGYDHALLDYFMFRDSSKVLGKFTPEDVAQHIEENKKWYGWYLAKGGYLEGASAEVRNHCFSLFGFYRAIKTVHERFTRLQKSSDTHKEKLTMTLKYGLMLAATYAKMLPRPWSDIVQ